MDKPLTVWYCDVCGDKITEIEKGYVVWKSHYVEEKLKYSDFKIIHKTKCDLDIEVNGCSLALENFISEKGLVRLMGFLSKGTIINNLYKNTSSSSKMQDMDEFVDFLRRVQTPYYEEARKYFNNPELLEFHSDSNEFSPYLPKNLKEIIKNYKNNMCD